MDNIPKIELMPAGMGQYQLGVCKAMLEQGILPLVVSGSSAGALVAAHVCCRTSVELLGPSGTLNAEVGWPLGR